MQVSGLPAIFEPTSGPSPHLTRLLLLRLRRLVWLRRSCVGQLEDGMLKTLDHAIYATFCDLLDEGAGEDARKLLRQAS